jgi:hypothetical protein
LRWSRIQNHHRLSKRDLMIIADIKLLLFRNFVLVKQLENKTRISPYSHGTDHGVPSDRERERERLRRKTGIDKCRLGTCTGNRNRNCQCY